MERLQRGWDKVPQLGESISGGAENHNGNPPNGEILLIGDLLIGSDHDLETGQFSRGKQNAVLQA
jgi:hypothetical protein